VTLNVTIVDYGIGNVRSILNAFDKVGITAVLSRDKEIILNSDGVVLPGVGAFSHGMSNLHEYELVDVLKEYAKTKKPLLGICLGMQMLLDESEEFGETEGIGLISGKVVQLIARQERDDKLPHVSWSEIEQKSNSWEGTILKNVPSKSDMYFVHSYVVVPNDEQHILATTKYSDDEFCSVIKKDNIYGCQFHPEKSATMGLQIIENFATIIKEHKE
jgi:glutamine amidotransferase